MVRHFEKNDLLPGGQHGFRSFHSTLTQLLAHWDSILEDLQEGRGVCIFGILKACDKAEYGVLLHKLKEFQITGNVGCWLATFLDFGSRRQAVAVDGRVSSLSPVISGITLGTELVPVLFLIHIEDIARGVSPSTSTTYLLMIQRQSKPSRILYMNFLHYSRT